MGLFNTKKKNNDPRFDDGVENEPLAGLANNDDNGDGGARTLQFDDDFENVTKSEASSGPNIPADDREPISSDPNDSLDPKAVKKSTDPMVFDPTSGRLMVKDQLKQVEQEKVQEEKFQEKVQEKVDALENRPEEVSPDPTINRSQQFEVSPEFQYWFNNMVDGDSRMEKSQNATIALTEMITGKRKIPILQNDLKYYQDNWNQVMIKLTNYSVQDNVIFMADEEALERWSRKCIENGMDSAFDYILARKDPSAFISISKYYEKILDSKHNVFIAPMFNHIKTELEQDQDKEFTNKIVNVVRSYQLSHYSNVDNYEFNVLLINAFLKGVKTREIDEPDYIINAMELFKAQCEQ